MPTQAMNGAFRLCRGSRPGPQRWALPWAFAAPATLKRLSFHRRRQRRSVLKVWRQRGADAEASADDNAGVAHDRPPIAGNVAGSRVAHLLSLGCAEPLGGPQHHDRGTVPAHADVLVQHHFVKAGRIESENAFDGAIILDA